MMSAVIAREPGGPEELQIVQRPVSIPQAGEVLIRVAAAGVNRPDLMQRSGLLTPHESSLMCLVCKQKALLSR